MFEPTLIRFLQARAVTGNMGATEYARTQYGHNSPVVRLLEKSISVDTTGWGSDPDFRSAMRGFVELVQRRSLIGKIQAVSGFRKVPFRIPVLKQTVLLGATWIQEGRQTPLTFGSFTQQQLDNLKIGTMIVLTDAVLKAAGADFEAAVSRDIVRPVAELEGLSFIDPNNAGIPGLAPASVTYGLTPLTGTSDPKADIKALLGAFQGDLETAVLVTSPKNGMALHDAGYEGAGAHGGDAAGLPLVTSTSVADTMIALIDPSGILLADGGAELDTSDQTTVQLEDSSGFEEGCISLFQCNLSAIKATRLLNWASCRPGAVSLTTSVAW